MKALSTVFLVALIVSASALAQGNGVEAKDKLQVIVDQQNAIKADLDDGGIDGVTPRQGSAIRKAQTEVFAIAHGKANLDDLSMDEKVRLENALERINAEIKGTRAGRDDRQVCWREAKTGSSVKVTRCGSEAELRQTREGARDWMDRPKVCAINCG